MTAEKTPPPRRATDEEIVAYIRQLEHENTRLAGSLAEAMRYVVHMADLLDEAGIEPSRPPDQPRIPANRLN